MNSRQSKSLVAIGCDRLTLGGRAESRGWTGSASFTSGRPTSRSRDVELDIDFSTRWTN